MSRVAVRPCRLHLNGLGGPVDASEHEVEPANAERLCGEVTAEIATEPRDDAGKGLAAADRLGKGEATPNDLRRHERIERLGGMPKGLVEPAAGVRTKAAGERRVRHRGELPDALEAKSP